MNGALSEVQLFLVAAAAFLVLASLACTPVAYVSEYETRCWAPEARHRALVWTSVLPAVLGSAAFLAAVAPPAIALALTGSDHCATHDDAHAHLCFAHFPKHGPNGIAWLVLAAGFAWLAAKATEGVAELMRARRLVIWLTAAATVDEKGCSIVESPRPLCLSVGLVAPRVVVSEGLLRHAEREHVRAAILHEQAHVRRKDALVRLAARAASVLYPAPTRRMLLRELDVAAERACDERAATEVGDRVSVAEAILHLEKLLQHDADLHSLVLVRAMSADAVSRRVESLLEPARTGGPTCVMGGGLSAALLALFVMSEPIHHAAESLLAVTLHSSR
jgi:Zn-dependent protease with chaperone function